MKSLSCLLVFSLGIFIQMSYCHSSITTCLPQKNAALFILGDSLFDNGNNNYINTTISYQANYYPYGETFFKYPSGRFSDGRMIPDVVAELAKLPILPPYLHPGRVEHVYGVNFASGGAGALRETSQGFVIDLKTQVSYLKDLKNVFSERLGNAVAEEIVSKSVYLISIGSNDYGTLLNPDSDPVFPPGDHQGFVDSVIGNLTDAIKEIYNVGGRKFGFVNVGPIGCVPAIRVLVNNGSTCLEEFSAIARQHNTALSEKLLELEKQLKGFKYSVNDFYGALSEVLNNPTKYGFKDPSVGCCGGGAYRGDQSCGGNKGTKEYELCDNVNEHLFFDSNHVTDRASQHFAELIWNGNHSVTTPYNLKQLFEF
ncbi:GDSL esterase/lipase 1-like [Vigna unguiculata]|uniref:GDSL esterase/lipase 1-like n=1 Tax=Vigna unguiculata TaxID=3917 RepID=UPI0010170B81|nr:GDSL esterase/lipase 1-like [Vigna unguiculata]